MQMDLDAAYQTAIRVRVAGFRRAGIATGMSSEITDAWSRAMSRPVLRGRSIRWDQVFRSQFVPKGCRNRGFDHLNVLIQFGHARRTGNDRGDGWMRQDELERSRLEVHSVSFAHGFQRPSAFYEVFGRQFIVVRDRTVQIPRQDAGSCKDRRRRSSRLVRRKAAGTP